MIAHARNVPAAAPNGAVAEVSPLTRAELYQLTLFKWRYALDRDGFTASEAEQLMFLKWRAASGRVAA
ncbi:MAG: hypothetical protein HYX52_06955 [Chloroflexi bacterium]|nr:hypothetical protein [Chloroflexota bacterium]